MEDYVKRKDSGIQKMNKSKWEQAIVDFNVVLDGLTPENDEQIVLKSICYLNRSMCHLFLKQDEKAFDDTTAVIKLYEQFRPESELAQLTPEKIQEDPLIPVLSLAYLRRGQAFEFRGALLDALQQYSVSCSLKLNDEAQQGMKHVLQCVGVPEIEQTDNDLKPFGIILLHLLNETNLTACLTQLMTYLQETELSDELVKKFNDTGVSRIVIGVLQLYIDNEIIAVGCLTSCRMLAEKGIADVFNGFLVIRHVLDNWKNNTIVIGNCIRFLQLIPEAYFEFMAKSDFIPPITEALKMEITPEECDASFYLLFKMAFNMQVLVQLVSDNILEVIFDKKTEAAFMLLSKIVLLKDASQSAFQQGAFEWALKNLESNEEVLQVGSMGILGSLLLNVDIEEAKASDIFDKVMPKIMAATKNQEIVSNGFGALAAAAPKAKAKVTETRAIRAASAILAIHTEEPDVSQNIVTFLFECAKAGLVSEIMETRSALPTAMNVLKTYPENMSIVERTVGLAILCDHPNKLTLLQAALTQFPDSKVLKPYVTLLPIDQLTK